MLDFVPYEPDHLRQIELQEHQAAMRPIVDGPEYADAIQRPELVWTARDGERVLGVAGILPLWETRAIGWAFFAPDVGGAHFLRITRRTNRFLDEVQAGGIRRIETTVDVEFLAGMRWMAALGFEMEGTMRCYCPLGRDHYLYARIR